MSDQSKAETMPAMLTTQAGAPPSQPPSRPTGQLTGQLTDQLTGQPTDQPINQGAKKPNTKMPPEIGGPKGLEPTRYGDWEVNGRCTDF